VLDINIILIAFVIIYVWRGKISKTNIYVTINIPSITIF